MTHVLVDALIERLEVREHGLLDGVTHVLDLRQGALLVALEELVELGAVDRQVAFDDLEALVDVPLHVLIVDQVLFELLGQLAAQRLDTVDLLGDALADLDDLLVDVAGEEVRALGRVLSRVLRLLLQLSGELLAVVANRGQLLHDVLDQALVEVLGLLVGLKAGIDLHLDHL